MNTQLNANTVAPVAPVEQSKRVGRPRSAAHVRVIYLHPETLEQRAVGKPKAGTKWIKATVQWSEDYVKGKTALLSQEEVTVQPQKKMAPRKVAEVAPVEAPSTGEVFAA